MLRHLHVIEREALESPLIEALLFALVKAVHRLQSLDELLPHSRSTPHLRRRQRLNISILVISHLSEGVPCSRIATCPAIPINTAVPDESSH